ncbi:MAG TPA: type II CAAX endopeptidase family protein [Terriglobia bacterium]|nr:type II CAAX endopeptidase family protein [Terriglobia bacterium]
MRDGQKQIVVFLFLAFLFSSLPYFVIIHAGHLAAGGGLMVTLLMWCPGLAAFATCKMLRIDLASLGWSWRPSRYVAWAYVIPILYALPVYVVTWILVRGSWAFPAFAKQMGASLGFPGWPRMATILLGLPLLATVALIGGLARTLGEEIGWRGFLLPRLVGQFGFTLGSLISGCVWALWHYPVLLFADYNAGTNATYALTCFTLMVFGDSFVFGWMRLRSKSVWPAAMLHASHNVFVQAIFDRMTAPAGKALYITTEFGCGLVLTVGAAALYFWTRRSVVEPAAVLDQADPEAA